MKSFLVVLMLLLSACASKDNNPDDPYESFNRKVYKFNKAFDATALKPVATVYKAILPPQVKKSVTNVYDNTQMLSTIANDVLQGHLIIAYKDSWRFFINSTIGVLGLFDVAELWGLPYKPNDFGITLAKWGDTNSPYIVIPLLGPSTIRDGVGMIFDYRLFSIYSHIHRYSTLYALLGLRYIDLRHQMLDKESIIDEALDEYSFVREAYLQNRNYYINGDPVVDEETIYVDEIDSVSKHTSRRLILPLRLV